VREEDTMANFGLFIGFGYPVRGRERQAAEAFQEALQYYGGLQQRGEIESVEAAFLEPHGGDLGGFLLLQGEAIKLNRLRYEDPEFQRLSARAQLVVEHFGIVMVTLGAGIEQRMGIFMSEASAVG
jgi:hypothetical protein